MTLRLLDVGFPTDFLVESHLPNRVRSNQKFAWRFFPPQIARKPVLFTIQSPKPKGVYRIFVLGGSAAVGVPQPAFNFSRILETMLEAQYPQIDFEVVNTAMVAINSHVVLPIIQKCAEYEPDLFIVYMGNNEVVGPFGAGSIFGAHTLDLSAIRLGLWLKTWRLGQVIDQQIQTLVASPALRSQTEWSGMKALLQNRIALQDVRLENVYHNFEKNLQDVVAMARKVNTPLMLCTVGVNLTDSAPFASLHRPDISESEQQTWERAYTTGSDHLENKNPLAARVKLLEAAAIDDHHANLHFQLGQCYAQLNDQDQAQTHYLLARDLDALRFRADTQINSLIRETVAQHQTENIHLVDIDHIMRETTGIQLPGHEFFYEHVHLTFEGNYTIAKSLYNKLGTLLPNAITQSPTSLVASHLTQEDCAKRLVFTEWSQYQMQKKILNLTNKPPFTYQSDYLAQRNRNLDLLSQYRRATPTADMLKISKGELTKAVKETPDDVYFRLRLADILAQSWPRDYAQALEQVRVALDLYPDDIDLLTYYGDILEYDGKFGAAQNQYERILKIMPQKTQAYLRIGHALAQQGKVGEAQSLFKKAYEKAPHSNSVIIHYGNFLQNRGQIDAARRIFSDGLTKARHNENPEYEGQYLQHLAELYFLQKRSTEALKYYREASTIFQEAAYPIEQANALTQIAHIYFFLKRYDGALSYFGKALTLLQKMSNSEQIRVLTNIGNLYNHQTNYKKALSYHLLAKEASDHFQDDHAKANALTNIAICNTRLGTPQKARPYLEEAAKIYGIMGLNQDLQFVRQLLSKI
ncbi:MAG: tetratricopeptide repeat protein [Candidatus Latescibacteria bacterium]|nr:tetratricopeptide repeat protein [Candidatus Latescibacterota bacterium]MBT5831553.1 tetratricopeptide repeat protein [Candidatus Latescibacterota bacterium]